MAEPFVIDGVCHPYNLAPENQRGDFGRAYTNVLWSFHDIVNPHRRMDRATWERDWQVEEFLRTMLLESDTDMVCVHSIPVFDAYHDGLVSVAKGAELKRRWPDRVLWYGTADIFQGLPALESLRHQVTELGADGIKLYPAQYYAGRTRYWRLDDYTVAYPVLELAMELGVRNVAVHKALPIGPIATDSMRIDDIGHAAAAFPEINFQIVHAGSMFLDETKMLLLNHPNVFATLEVSFLFCLLDPPGFAQLMGELLAYGGPEKVIYASAAVNPHPRPLLEAFAGFAMPSESRIQLTPEIRAAILGGNLARLHGIDVEQRRAELAGDGFARERERHGLRPSWSERLGVPA
ncbi:amidohydrolase family protein [Plantactinospora siamensis]|uniref:Amidohydrolase family protein n=1 Tax=Plantactinospora siamensis TaxID=555372 RepID=A0ABV6NRS0_9ACTN